MSKGSKNETAKVETVVEIAGPPTAAESLMAKLGLTADEMAVLVAMATPPEKVKVKREPKAKREYEIKIKATETAIAYGRWGSLDYLASYQLALRADAAGIAPCPAANTFASYWRGGRRIQEHGPSAIWKGGHNTPPALTAEQIDRLFTFDEPTETAAE